jgi:hypothetical protein
MKESARPPLSGKPLPDACFFVVMNERVLFLRHAVFFSSNRDPAPVFLQMQVDFFERRCILLDSFCADGPRSSGA